jgi:hypothetical protein
VLFAGFEVEVDFKVVVDVGTVICWIDEDGVEPLEAATDPAADDAGEVAVPFPVPVVELPGDWSRLAPFGELYGGGVAWVGSTYAPVPHGKAAPPGCVAFVGGVVAPDAEAMVNRPVHDG